MNNHLRDQLLYAVHGREVLEKVVADLKNKHNGALTVCSDFCMRQHNSADLTLSADITDDVIQDSLKNYKAYVHEFIAVIEQVLGMDLIPHQERD